MLDTWALLSSSTASYTVTGAGGDTSLFVEATSGDGLDVTSVAITATCTPAAVKLTSTPAAPAQVGQSYVQTNVASGGTTPYTYSVSAGTLPLGTALSTATGTVSGTPTTAGVFSYTVKVTDSTSPTAGTATQTVSGTIAAATSTTSITSSANPSRFGQAVTFTATIATGGGTATGTVTFKDGVMTLGTATVSGNQATFTTASPSSRRASLSACSAVTRPSIIVPTRCRDG